jgi:hypothetical protein
MRVSITNRRVAGYSIAALAVLVLTACGQTDRTSSLSSQRPDAISTVVARSASSGETAVPREVNPPGDIPDSQTFVEYDSPAGYALEVPEGWARSVRGSIVVFSDKLDGVSITISPKSDTLSSIKAAARAAAEFKTKEVTLAAGHAVKVMYSSNSEPDPVTGKKIRLTNEAVVFEHGAQHATLRVWAPLGADNADQWTRVEKSFRFR